LEIQNKEIIYFVWKSKVCKWRVFSPLRSL